MASSYAFSGHSKRVVPRRREPSGKLQRMPEQEVKAANLSVVLAQPHRLGSADDRRHWPFGRMILDRIIRSERYTSTELERAADRYAKVQADMQWVMDSRRPFFASVGGGRREPTPKERADIEREAGDVRRVLRDCPNGERVTRAMDAAYSLHPDFEVRCINPAIPPSCATGLEALIRHWGMA